MMVLSVLVALGCLAFCIRFLRQAHDAGKLQLLADVDAPAPPTWPRLSVVIAACNEVATLEQALATVLADDYPALEIVLVDDRSTDGTGALIDRMAATDARIRPVHIEHLPDGWLGKVNALERGVRDATGEYLLFTDADVHFRPGALRRAVALCRQRAVDHLVVLPDARSGTLLEEVAINAMGAVYLRRTRAVHVENPRARACAGVGAFNLVRRDTLLASEGLAWLRMEVLDDVGLGVLLRRAGARSAFLVGTDTVSLTWYASLRDMAGGVEKNLFGWLARYDLFRLGASILGTLALLLAPVLAPFLPGPAPLWLGSVLAGLSLILSALVVARRTRRRLLPLMMQPLGELIIAALTVRSAVQCLRRDGIVWRGTAYPLTALRAGQRVRL